MFDVVKIVLAVVGIVVAVVVVVVDFGDLLAVEYLAYPYRYFVSPAAGSAAAWQHKALERVLVDQNFVSCPA